MEQPAAYHRLPVAGFSGFPRLAGMRHIIGTGRRPSPKNLAERVAQQIPFLGDVPRQAMQCRNADQREENKRDQQKPSLYQ